MAWQRNWQYSAETQSIADIQLYGGGATAPTISATEKFTGSYSYRGSTGFEPFGRSFSAGIAAVRAGAYIWHNAIEVNDTVHVFTLPVGSTYIAVQWEQASNSFRLRAGFASGSSTQRYPIDDVSVGAFATTGTWFHIGIVAYLHATAGFVTFYVDGQPILTWTGDTRIYNSGDLSAQTEITGCYVAGALGPLSFWNQYVYVDDFYIDTNSGIPADYPPSSRRFVPAFPISDTATADWTPNTGSDHYAMVDEAPPDDDTTRLKADGPGLTDIFNFSTVAVPSPDWSVRAAIVVAYARKTDANFDSTLRLVQEYDGTIEESDERELGVSYNNVWGRWETPPGEETWTEARINQAKFGIRSDGSFSDYG